ncbi:MAG TPA: glycosyltransferase family 4 protein [Streptosporangiaceae bacterium]|nr:glycosyltransferase family 4 protein [Streptosporangiaceae bacterium]
MELRITHVSAHYPPSPGGMAKVVEHLAAQQRTRGYEVDVLTSLDARVRPDDVQPDKPVKRLRSWEIAHTLIIPGLVGELLRLPRSSVVHLHVAQAYIPEAVYVAHRLRGLPYVAHLHLDVGPSGWAGFMLRAYKPLVLARVLRAAAVTVVFTEGQRTAISAKYRLDPGKVVVIPNGVDTSFFRPGDRRLPSTADSRPRLLFVGRLSSQKNLGQLLHALDGVSDRFDTTLVGGGEQEAELKQAVAEMRLKNVRFHGPANGTGLLELYRRADVFVLPSEREGMPLVLLEALAMGLPIVATDIPGSRELVVDGENGYLVPVGDPAALRRALLNSVSDADKYRKMSEASRRIAAHYSWSAVGAQFEQVYAQALARRG